MLRPRAVSSIHDSDTTGAAHAQLSVCLFAASCCLLLAAQQL